MRERRAVGRLEGFGDAPRYETHATVTRALDRAIRDAEGRPGATIYLSGSVKAPKASIYPPWSSLTGGSGIYPGMQHMIMRNLSILRASTNHTVGEAILGCTIRRNGPSSENVSVYQ